ncbi:HdeD family acid-resistance protein [Streptomyces griseiscabiei]|uniref:HdeD family acid-resistance protein n=1 Tax=Streptomyces griseiscabiei TaxID=2993540 RepID=A0ABU4L8A1_9ACTN|nr:HdeD family acid-resistance protein [Streptomyces griseiscabiei]MBZ3905185.1 HdeD family acid-resistance protein [Streptomyces griseiscabiei]MDX2911893.1 HdeD family acid-resistance protein [Streptomyces griseiscabiei]
MFGSRNAKAAPTARDAASAPAGTGVYAAEDLDAETARLSRGFGRLAVLGVVLVIAGIVGLCYVGFATLTSMILFGWLLLVGGAIGLLHAVEARGTNFFWLGVVVAALNIAAGVVVIKSPEAAAEALTMFAALLFLTGGVFRLVGSLVVRGPQFGWTLVQGAFGLLLGILVLASWPSSSKYVIGTFFSLALLFDGLGLIATGFGGRRVVGLVSERLTESERPQEEGDRSGGKPVQPE